MCGRGADCKPVYDGSYTEKIDRESNAFQATDSSDTIDDSTASGVSGSSADDKPDMHTLSGNEQQQLEASDLTSVLSDRISKMTPIKNQVEESDSDDDWE